MCIVFHFFLFTNIQIYKQFDTKISKILITYIVLLSLCHIIIIFCYIDILIIIIYNIAIYCPIFVLLWSKPIITFFLCDSNYDRSTFTDISLYGYSENRVLNYFYDFFVCFITIGSHQLYDRPTFLLFTTVGQCYISL